LYSARIISASRLTVQKNEYLWSMQETELVNRLKQRDEEAFRIIFNDNQKKVINACYRLVNDINTAEDLTQEVFIKVYSSIEQFRGESQLSTWIYRIAITKSLDHIRAQKRKKRLAILKYLSGDEERQIEIEAPKDQSPDTLIDNAERMKVLNDAMSKLPENQRIAFSLSKYDEMSSKEIAEVLSTSVSAVESLIHRAKKNLEKRLFNYYKKQLN
jgi:RNA polymerase sigma-70 factor, ECF subfamily